MTNNILELKNVRKKFKNFVIDNVTFSLPKGYVMGLVGKNGSGKTAIIKLILNILSLDSGTIKIFDKDHRNTSIKDDIGIIIDENIFLDEWTILEAEKIIKPFYKNWDSVKFKELLNKFSLDINSKIAHLSKGMKMKLMIATSLSHGAKLLIYDEPTNGLDYVIKDQIIELLRDFVYDENCSVLFSTQITSDIEKIADYLTVIDNGKIKFSDSLDNLLDSFVVIKGSKEDINNQKKKLIIGYQENTNGFSGLIKKEDLSQFKSVSVDRCSLDELLLKEDKGGMYE